MSPKRDSTPSATISSQHRYTVTPEHLIKDTRITPLAFRLWCLLERYSGADGQAYPKRETLAVDLDVSPASIDRAKKNLIDYGWLTVTRSRGSLHFTVMQVAAAQVTKVNEKARQERAKATEPRRAAKAERQARWKASQGEGVGVDDVTVNSSSDEANVQVSGLNDREHGTRVVTDDDSGEKSRVVTDADSRVVTDADSRVVTDDDQKEAPLKEAPLKEDSDPSLRSGSADADAPSALPGLPVPAVAERNITHEAFTIAGDFLAWFERERNKGQSVPGRDRTKAALAKSHIAPALEAGATVDQIKRALSKCRIELPSMPEWREQLRIARGGSNVTPLHGRRAYNDAETWGDTKAREQAVADRANLTPEQVAAQIEAAFTPRRNATNAE